MRTIPKNRRPIAPGKVLQEDFLDKLERSQSQLAKVLYVNRTTVNDLINGRNGVSSEMAVRLATALGTTPQYWLNLQSAVDLYDAMKSPHIRKITPIVTAARTDTDESGGGAIPASESQSRRMRETTVSSSTRTTGSNRRA